MALDVIFWFVILAALVAVFGIIGLEVGWRRRWRANIRKRQRRLADEQQRAIDWAEYLRRDAQAHSGRQWARYELQSQYYDNRFRRAPNGTPVIRTDASE